MQNVVQLGKHYTQQLSEESVEHSSTQHIAYANNSSLPNKYSSI